MSGPSYIWKKIADPSKIDESEYIIINSNHGKLVLCQWWIEIGPDCVATGYTEVPVKISELETIDLVDNA